MPTIQGPITIGPGMTDADRAKLKPFISLGGAIPKTEAKAAEPAKPQDPEPAKPVAQVEIEFTAEVLKKLSRKQLNWLCKELGLKGYSKLKEGEVIAELLKQDPAKGAEALKRCEP